MSTPRTPSVYAAPAARLRGIRGGFAAVAALAAAFSVPSGGQEPPTRNKSASFDSPKYAGAQTGLVEVRRYIRLDQARKDFAVDGKGTCVAVIDSGLRTTHEDFRAKRIPARVNFTGGAADDVTDEWGSGTHNAGIIAANNFHVGVAPEADIVPLKVFGGKGATGTFETIDRALGWVVENHRKHNISAVSLCLGDGRNHASTETVSSERTHAAIRLKLVQLREARVAVVAPSGNGYAEAKQQGMVFPAVVPETISVGAVYDANGGAADYGDIRLGSTRPGQIMSFSQRLSVARGKDFRTDIFAPGALLVSSGHDSNKGEAIQTGTSKAAAVVTGTVLLLQQYHRRVTGKNPTVDQVEEWLRGGGEVIADTHPKEVTGVTPTGETFIRLDALGALAAARRSLQKELLLTGKPFRDP